MTCFLIALDALPRATISLCPCRDFWTSQRVARSRFVDDEAVLELQQGCPLVVMAKWLLSGEWKIGSTEKCYVENQWEQAVDFHFFFFSEKGLSLDEDEGNELLKVERSVIYDLSIKKSFDH